MFYEELKEFWNECEFSYQLCHPDLAKMMLGENAQAIQICVMHPASGKMVGDVYNYTENKDVGFEKFRENMVKTLKQRVEENSNVKS